MKNKLLTFLIVLLAIAGFNLLAKRFFFRIDLTEEKRYTISKATQNLLENLDDEVYVKVYLTGKSIPGGFKRLENAVQETLEEFQIHAGSKIKYRFVDLYDEVKDEKKRNKIFIELAQKGIPPTNVLDKENGHQVQTLIAPGALITYKDKEVAVLLLKGNKLASPQEILNQSYEGVEYQLASAIKQLTLQEKKKIGFFINYSHLPAVNQLSLIGSLKKFYELYPVDLRNSPTLDGLDAIFVLKPDTPFSDNDKYKIDQFIMNGGKALFFMNSVKIDTVAREGNLAQPLSVNLEDMLFKYGVRLNFNLIKDAQMCAAIPMDVGNFGNRNNIQMVPWVYFPLINTFGNSPIVRNLDAIYTKYVGSIDSVKAPGITKTPLLMTSAYTQVINAPATLSYDIAGKEINPAQYNAGSKTIAYLLEGSFQSLFLNRILSDDPRAKTFQHKGKSTKIIVCSDGNIPTNDFDIQKNTPLPVGFDKFSGNTFANKDFILNAIDYLLDENGVISARNKEVTLRPLDKALLQTDRTKWQIINLVIPIGLIILLGLIHNFIRKRKFEMS
ncbi:gliding-associated putative ABC transporter substrate-binding component GldG [Pseudarcicella hirudinis]|uniref:Gliding-associated putative ABC transporter substrate-binding component GldG n=2 Tax=Pseudarcicella hirudinis TaxID=1079859 RepID=A0A1I5Z0M8_9BACT|nr:gliding motility-associated ABC transporter substrate-binding protein GldG [Pseudarcicella hirudinis]SFQ50036.1 gliding-associated putative ABC transporter substrate-binding component GldG [Pseudarcicella hirudinis]